MALALCSRCNIEVYAIQGDDLGPCAWLCPGCDAHWQIFRKRPTGVQLKMELEPKYSYQLKNYLGMTVVENGPYSSLAQCKFDANAAFQEQPLARWIEIYDRITTIEIRHRI